MRSAPRLGSPPQRGAPPKAVRGTLSPHTQPPTTKHTQPPPATRKKRTPKPHDTAAIRSADKSPARLENGSGARADRMPDKGTANPLPTNAEFARPIFQTGNHGDLSKASPAACFFASFFAPKKEVRDCQGAHSPLIQFRGAPTTAQPPPAAAHCRELASPPQSALRLPAPLCGGEFPLRRGARN